MQQEPRCTHTNEELILRVKDWIINLAKSGGKAWALQIPANVNEDPDLLIGELITRFKALLKPGNQSAGTWVKASERLPKIIDKKAAPKHVKCEVKKQDGSGAWIKKQVAYYFPEHFKTIEWEDWDDYSEEDFPYTENDEKNGIVWLRPGWYSSVECDNCEGYWSAPLNVVEWLDESTLPDNKDREMAFGVWLMENAVAQYENKKLHSFRLFGPYTDNIDYTPQEVYAYWESLTNKPRP